MTAWFLFVWTPGFCVLEKIPASIILTTQENGTIPQSEFFCTGKIHGYIRLPNRQQGAHILEGVWTLPNGRVLQHSRNEVDFAPPGRSTAYIWFAFPERRVLSLNPDTNTERLSYPGIWKVEARWDGNAIVRSTFTVHCQ